MYLVDAIEVLPNGDGNEDAADVLTIGTSPMAGTKGTLAYDQLVELWAQFDPYELNTSLICPSVMVQMLETAGAAEPADRPQLPGHR